MVAIFEDAVKRQIDGLCDIGGEDDPLGGIGIE